MISLILAALSYTAIGLLISSTARRTDMPRNEKLRYSIIWPWLFIATLGYFLWYSIFPGD